MQQVLEDYETAPIATPLRLTLGLLKKMTLTHANLGPGDVRPVIEAGVTKEAIADALEVAFLFNIYDRLADTMGWDVPEHRHGFYQSAAKRLLTHGYRT